MVSVSQAYTQRPPRHVQVCMTSPGPPLTSFPVAPQHYHHTNSQVTSEAPVDTITPTCESPDRPDKLNCQQHCGKLEPVQVSDVHGTPQRSSRHLELESGPRVQNWGNSEEQLSPLCPGPAPRWNSAPGNIIKAHTLPGPCGPQSSRRGLGRLWGLGVNTEDRTVRESLR